jgi:hypothetical protein
VRVYPPLRNFAKKPSSSSLPWSASSPPRHAT